MLTVLSKRTQHCVVHLDQIRLLFLLLIVQKLDFCLGFLRKLFVTILLHKQQQSDTCGLAQVLLMDKSTLVQTFTAWFAVRWTIWAPAHKSGVLAHACLSSRLPPPLQCP